MEGGENPNGAVNANGGDETPTEPSILETLGIITSGEKATESNTFRDGLLKAVVAGVLTRSPPDCVFHYTSPLGLIGICEERAIWATDARYVNDAAEVEYTVDLARGVLRRLMPTIFGGGGRLYDLLLVAAGQVQETRFYIASFSENGNQLSQWRAYCPPAGGFAVGFKPTRMGRLGDYSLYPCQYDRRQQEKLVEAVVRTLVKEWAVAIPPALDFTGTRKAIEFSTAFKTSIAFFATVFKSPGFSEENEWRIVVRHDDGDSPVRFRSGRSGIVPYLAIPIVGNGDDVALTRVYVGPNPHPELAIDAVGGVMKSHGIVGVTVAPSEIPYRTW